MSAYPPAPSTERLLNGQSAIYAGKRSDCESSHNRPASKAKTAQDGNDRATLAALPEHASRWTTQRHDNNAWPNVSCRYGRFAYKAGYALVVVVV